MLIVIHLLRIKLYDMTEGEGGFSPEDISGDHTQLGSRDSPEPGRAGEP